MLEEVFAIRIAAYAVMGNHHHVVLYLDIGQGRPWGRDEAIGRWMRLFSGDPQLHSRVAKAWTESDQAAMLPVFQAGPGKTES